MSTNPPTTDPFMAHTNTAANVCNQAPISASRTATTGRYRPFSKPPTTIAGRPIARINPFALCTHMSSARFTYLIDFSRKDADAYVRCAACDHQVTIPTAILFKLFSPLTPLEKAGVRLVCSRCGKKGHRLIPVPQSNAKPFRVAKPDAAD
jgi:DNA-directed RNA polymerase subunit RPC12/RpoP